MLLGVHAGAGLFGVALTWVLPTTLEDLLAASLAGLAGYISLLNLPLKRADAKAKLQRNADGFLQVGRQGEHRSYLRKRNLTTTMCR